MHSKNTKSVHLLDGVTMLPLTQGKWVAVDTEDFPLVSPYSWHVARRTSGWYATAWVNGVKTYLHRHLMSPPDGLIVDHINHDTLDNRRENLRLVTHSENSANALAHRDNLTGYKGIEYQPKTGRWCARICINYRRYSLGFYETAEDAARAYDRGALALRGEHASLNFPDD